MFAQSTIPYIIAYFPRPVASSCQGVRPPDLKFRVQFCLSGRASVASLHNTQSATRM
jgi:hypothetical protein